MNSPIEIGNVEWNNNDIINEIDNFLKIYDNRPLKTNKGGMSSIHCFATFFILKKINKAFIVESGVWKGQSTYLIEKTCPNSELMCIEPIPSRILYKSKNAKYTINDFSTLNIINPTDTICFFDDHQNAVNRIKQAVQKGIKNLIFEDNYPVGQGDCISLKQTLELNNEDSKYIREHIKIYYEFPPLFIKEYTRWNTKWNLYPTKQPIFNEINNELITKKYNIFHEDATDYTWISYVELK